MMSDKRLSNLNQEVSRDYLLEILDYCPNSGILRWKSKLSRTGDASTAGWKHNKGYIAIGINCKNYLAHRVIWCIVYGYWPKHLIDHADGNKSNNSLINLRKASSNQNAQNAKLRKDSTSNVKGVSWLCGRNKWVARVQSNGMRKTIGYFSNLEDAETAVKAYRALIHNDFANNGENLDQA